jgi:low affinity Fe/Cu permease
MSITEKFAELADFTARAAGRPIVFAVVSFLAIGWVFAGPIFHFSTEWQMLANTSTSIITFLMVFLIQNSQNRDTAAIQAKLDEIIRATEGHPALVGIEERTQDEIERVKDERNVSLR